MLQDDARDVHLVMEDHQDTTSFGSYQSLSSPATPIEAALPPGSLPPGSLVISNMEAVDHPYSIDTFIQEVGKMKREEEEKSNSRRESESTGSVRHHHQPMTAEKIKEGVKSGEVLVSEML